MMSHRFLWVALAGLLIAGLLFGGISAAQRSAWNEGFMMGRLTASGDGSPVLPYAYGYGVGPAGGSSFGGFGLLLGVGLLFFLFAGFSRMGRRHAWGMHGQAPGTPPWGQGAPPWGQGAPPWARGGMKGGCRGWSQAEEPAAPAADPVPPAASPATSSER